MSRITIEKGFRDKLWDVATSIHLPCAICHRDIDLKSGFPQTPAFGCIREPHLDTENIRFLCIACFKKIQDFIVTLIKEER